MYLTFCSSYCTGDFQVECPKYPGFCITRQRKEYPFIEIFHSPEQVGSTFIILHFMHSCLVLIRQMPLSPLNWPLEYTNQVSVKIDIKLCPSFENGDGC